MTKTIMCDLCGVEVPYSGNRKKYCKYCKRIMDITICGIYQQQQIKKRYCKYCNSMLSNTERIVCKGCRPILHKEKQTLYKARPEYKEQRKNHDLKYKKSKHGKLNNLINNRLRRAKLNEVKHHFTEQEWEEKLNNTKGVCPMCKRNIGVEKLTLDHIYPISKAKKGRIYTINDVQPLCGKCNCSKKDKVES